MHRHARRQSAVIYAKMAEPIDLPFELWTLDGPKEAQVQLETISIAEPLRNWQHARNP